MKAYEFDVRSFQQTGVRCWQRPPAKIFRPHGPAPLLSCNSRDKELCAAPIKYVDCIKFLFSFFATG